MTADIVDSRHSVKDLTISRRVQVASDAEV